MRREREAEPSFFCCVRTQQEGVHLCQKEGLLQKPTQQTPVLRLPILLNFEAPKSVVSWYGSLS